MTRYSSHRRPWERPTRRERGGFLVVAALVCLLIVTSIVGSMLQSALRARRQLHSDRDRRQAELLLDAGADRALLRLAAEPDFRGDIWQLPADSIVGRGEGRVTTEVSRSANDDSWQLLVVAEYRLGGAFPIKRSNTFQLTITTRE